ncbi:MAG: TDP-N-acetylfucosamine:lipid II N-acetylfucosaminyltransferase [Spirochaetales bacterium]|jgi:dTDP-N-acetylfucosamine:lipid II N-acetylfucosaminyltransferase|nr:TDP-N-acetylfucosamine:lipid II N-acetylfucosaminyltransferase [Spirochaetales bacterium]
MNIIHLVRDEKFIDFFSKKIKGVSSDTHLYVVHVEDPSQKLSFIKETEVCKKVGDKYFCSKEMEDDLSGCDVLVVHFLTVQAARMVLKAASHVKVVWSGWGADYYCLLSGGQRALYGSETRKIIKDIDRARIISNPFNIARIMSRPLRKIYLLRKFIFPAIKRVNLFSSPLPVDYDLLRQCIGKYFSAKYVQLNYGDCKSTFATGSKGLKGNILVGNSASATNNHLEVFNILKRINLEGRKVIVPLSYGDPVYRDHVIKYGHRILGEHFCPIVNFMPLTEYNNLIGSCSVVIMNQFRQQALGNIGSVLCGGSKLYLNRRNVTFDFLSDRGAIIFSIDDMVIGSDDFFCELSLEQKKINENVINSFWSEDIVDDNFMKFISVLSE